jgi:MPBQ/MSBQ methyltransferase
MSDDLHDVERHWYDGVEGALLERIDAALEQDGKDPQALTLDDLMVVDELHIRGREATAEMMALAKVRPSDRVIDVGAGIGGPSRYLASSCGCHVTGIDLTAEYCGVANALAARIGLGDRVTYRQANALDMPFEDHTFDVAWTQHISMNIPDKRAFFGEMRRVVRPGGRLVIYDPILGNGDPLDYPVPWSRDGAINFLIDAEETRRALEALDLEITQWEDVSEKSITWFAANAQRSARPSALGIHLVLGEDWRAMSVNMVKNLVNGRLAVVQVLAERR